MNKVIYGAYTFEDAALSLLAGGKATTYYSPLGDELRAAYFSIPVQFFPRVWVTSAEDFKAGAQFGQQVDIYEDSTLLTRFYLTDITGGQKQQDGSYIFNLVGTDFVGLFAGVQHLGGIYSNVAAGTVIAEILGASKISEDADNVTYEVSGIQFTVDAEQAYERIDNWLPVTSDARENLRSILQVINAVPQQAADGTPHFGPLDPGAGLTVGPYETYAGDTYEQSDPVTGVQVVEYAFYQGADTPEELIYDATDISANNSLITFDTPYFDLRGDNLTKNEEGANYAIVTGAGKLYGKPYTIAKRVITAATGKTGADNIKTIDNPLCSSLYSSTLLQRMVNYFGDAKLVRNAVVMPSFYDSGKLMSYTDPMNEEQQGYATEVTATFSGITKADQRITAGWQPSDATPFTEEQVFTADGTFTTPAGATRIRFVLIGGGKGGWGGYPGEVGTADDTASGHSGDGGQPGEGGDGALIEQIDIEGSDIAASYTFTIGEGGAGGAIDHGEGQDGTPTTVTDGVQSYSSATGSRYNNGLLDIFTGIVYAKHGQTGIYAGGPGEDFDRDEWSMNDALTSQTGTVATWFQGIGHSWTTSGVIHARGGGGPAYGSNGHPNPLSEGYLQGADAALDGFNGYTAPVPTIQGTGGLGGNGGGGAGIGQPNQVSAGHGSIAADGAAGILLVYIAYGAIPPTPDDHNLLDANGEQLFDFYFEKLKEA